MVRYRKKAGSTAVWEEDVYHPGRDMSKGARKVALGGTWWS